MCVIWACGFVGVGILLRALVRVLRSLEKFCFVCLFVGYSSFLGFFFFFFFSMRVCEFTVVFLPYGQGCSQYPVVNRMNWNGQWLLCLIFQLYRRAPSIGWSLE